MVVLLLGLGFSLLLSEMVECVLLQVEGLGELEARGDLFLDVGVEVEDNALQMDDQNIG